MDDATQPGRSTAVTPPATGAAAAPAKELQLAAVGIDSSHLPEFAKRIRALRASGASRCRVTQMWTDGRHGMPADQVEKWRMQAEAEGVVMADDLDAMLDGADGVLVLAVDGHVHAELAEPALKRGLPTYIDKPLTCDLADARCIVQWVRDYDAPCYSASSLRFASEPRAVRDLPLGALTAIDAYGPGELSDANPGLFFYGVHTIEMVDAIWGPGVRRVRSEHHPDRDLLDLEYHDGRFARLRMERVASYDFGATVHGTEGAASFRVDFATVYDRLVEGMVRFFEGGPAPADLEHIVENIAVIETAHRSVEHGGVWLDLPDLA